MDEIEYLGATSTMLSYNLFTYCEGNPVNRVDNDGQSWKDVKDWLSNILDNVKKKVYSVYYNATKCHLVMLDFQTMSNWWVLE